MNRKKVLFLFGGQSSEHEVSIVSSKAVIENLDKEKFEPIEVGITKTGKWVIGGDLEKLKKGESVNPDYELILSERRSVENENLHSLLKINKDKIIEEILFDIVFPILHGTFGEDGTLQGLLEFNGIPYVGADLTTSLIGIDKVLFKNLMKSEKLPIAKFLYYYRSFFDLKNAKEEIKKTLEYPLFVKPSNTGSSVGITKVHNESELENAVNEAFKFFDKILIEEAVPNAKEIEVSALGNWDEFLVSDPGEIIPGDEFYSYKDKYIDDKAELKFPAILDSDTKEEVISLAKRIYKLMFGTGMARIDFLVNAENNEIFVNEANTIPGFTSISMYPKLWGHLGLSFSDLVTKLINLGFERYEEKCKNVLSIDSDLLKK